MFFSYFSISDCSKRRRGRGWWTWTTRTIWMDWWINSHPTHLILLTRFQVPFKVKQHCLLLGTQFVGFHIYFNFCWNNNFKYYLKYKNFVLVIFQKPRDVGLSGFSELYSVKLDLYIQQGAINKNEKNSRITSWKKENL